jgi:hypothetical protein
MTAVIKASAFNFIQHKLAIDNPLDQPLSHLPQIAGKNRRKMMLL